MDKQERPESAGKRWLVFAKLTLGIGLIAALILSVEVSELLQALGSVNLYFLAVVFLVPHIMIATSTLKWQLFLRQLGMNTGFGRLFSLYMIGTFFNNFFPTMVGGDAVRVYALSRDTKNSHSVTAATFMERIVGFAALMSMLPLILLSPTAMHRFPALWLVVVVCVVGFCLGTYAVLTSKFDPVWRRLSRTRLLNRILTFLSSTRKAVYLSIRSRAAVAAAYLLSLLFYVGAAATVWAAARSVGANVEITYLLATVPLVLVFGMLPISLNGLGITEAGFAVFLQLAGVPLVDAVAVGLLLRGRLLFTALVGGLLFLRYRSSSMPVQAKAPSLER